VSECDRKSSIMRPWPTGGHCAIGENNNNNNNNNNVLSIVVAAARTNNLRQIWTTTQSHQVLKYLTTLPPLNEPHRVRLYNGCRR
jgi:hypothetical protein